jgi:pimeloyl-ACP methyl ester carboxylesterase
MPTAPSNGIELFYDTFGSASDPALLLVMGLGAQMTLWDEDFCSSLAGNGFHVIRFDNRDVGLSTKFEAAGAPDMAKVMTGDASAAPYTLWDMADDAVGLLDHLGIAKAHIVGASMGGMIVQAMAIRHPDRLLSLTSIMSTSGNPTVGQPKPEAMAALMAPPPTTREAAIEQGVVTWKTIGGTFPVDEPALRARIERDYDRSFYPVGTARQMAAIVTNGDRTEALKAVKVPTLVIHGEVDPLVTLSGGKATAEAIPGAELVVIPQMGHDMPPVVVPRIVEAIVANARKAGQPASA